MTARRLCRGAVLLEVVLALTMFFIAAGVVVGGLQTATQAARKVRLDATAADLAVTVMSEIQMGYLPAGDAPATEFEYGPADWTWEVATEPMELSENAPPLQRVSVTVRHGPTGYLYRIVQMMPLADSFAGEPTAGGGM
jgi:type II secretory pathway pseudopilin PulG